MSVLTFPRVSQPSFVIEGHWMPPSAWQMIIVGEALGELSLVQKGSIEP